jgi:hypothetical protein
VVHTYNPSYAAGRGRRIMALNWPLAKMRDPIWKIKAKMTGCVAQVVQYLAQDRVPLQEKKKLLGTLIPELRSSPFFEVSTSTTASKFKVRCTWTKSWAPFASIRVHSTFHFLYRKPAQEQAITGGWQAQLWMGSNKVTALNLWWA